ncbi:MAG TPA: CDP-alcohol phosphatidyltransferase family protein [Kofleriaceae bacterium]
MSEPVLIQIGDSDGHRRVLGGLTVLERVIRGLGKEGVRHVQCAISEPFDVEKLGVPRVPHNVRVEWVPAETKPKPGQRVVRGDVIAGVMVKDRETQKRAEWAVFKGLPKTHQGPTDALVNQHFSLRITRVLCHTRIHPNHITIASFFWGLVACAIALQGTWTAMAIGGVMMQVHNILDSCDGEIARLRYQFTKSGAWLDNVMDEVIDDLFVASIGIATGGIWMWIGIAGGGARLLANVIQWEEMIHLGSGGSAWVFRYWFEKPDASADEVHGRKSALYWFRAFGRRDTFVFGWMILLLVGVPEAVVIWGALNGIVILAPMLLHVVLRPKRSAVKT